MKKNTVKIMSLAFMGMLAAGAMTSCSQDDENGSVSPQTASNKVSFIGLVDNANGTRALPTTATNYLQQVKDFKVWGTLVSDGSYYLGANGEGGILIDNKNNGSWDYHTATDMVYWPSGALNFYAVTPSANANYTFDGTNLTYTVPTDQSQQVDLMVANANNQTKETNTGIVNLPFKHMLSQVVFKGITKSSNLTVEVKSITIHNVNSKMTTTLTAGTSVASDPATYAAFGAGIATAKTIATTDAASAVSLSDEDGALLLVPQTLAGWTNNTTIADADAANQSYLEIELKVTSKTSGTSQYLIGSPETYGKTYVSLPASWQAGKRYVYTLQFGGGKNANGEDQFQPITFTVNVEDWVDTPSNIDL